MKNYILLLLLATFGMQAQTYQNPTYGNLKLKTNQTSTTAAKVNVQEADGTINTIAKTDLIDVVEVNDVPSLPLVGVAGKIYVVKNLNKVYRWNVTFYQELSEETTASIQSKRPLKTIESQSLEGSGNIDLTKADVGLSNVDNTSDINKPISTATQTALDGKQSSLGFTPEDVVNKVTSIGASPTNTNYPSELAVKTYADGLVVGMLNDRGSWDASVNVFPSTGGSGTSGAIRKGDMWYVSVAGVLGGKAVNIGDSFRALVDSPAQVSGNWSVLEANVGYVPANDANVVHLTGNETIAGIKTFNETPVINKLVTVTNKGQYYDLLKNGAGSTKMVEQVNVWNGSAYVASNNGIFSGNTAGQNNTGSNIGSISGNAAGSNNTGSNIGSISGSSAGQNNTGSNIGSISGNTAGQYNTGNSIGSISGNAAGSNNTGSNIGSISGSSAGQNNTGDYIGNISGYFAGNNNTGSNIGSISGNAAGSNNTGSNIGSISGSSAGQNNTGSNIGSISGNAAGSNNTGSNIGSISGSSAGQNNTGSNIGSISGNTAGQYNTGNSIGSISGNAAGSNNTGSNIGSISGSSAGQNNTGDYIGNISGYFAGNNNTGSNIGSISGNAAGSNNTGSNIGSISGSSAGQNNTGDYIGNISGYFAGNNNTGSNIGSISGGFAGRFNVGNGIGDISGYQAGQYNTGSNNIIGHNSHSSFLDNVSGAKTVSSIDIATERITITAHGFGSNNSYVNLKYTTTETAIGGLSNNSIYQVQIIDANTIFFRLNNLTSEGTGTHTFTPQFKYDNVNIFGNNVNPTASNQTIVGNPSSTQFIGYGKHLVNTTTDNGIDQLQVNGTISASPATTSNQVVVKSQLDLKANKDNATLTGTPTAPTATVGTNTTQIATTAFVQQEILGSTNLIHTTGNETKTGTLTFDTDATSAYFKIVGSNSSLNGGFEYINQNGTLVASLRNGGAAQGHFKFGTSSAYLEGREAGPTYLRSSVAFEAPSFIATSGTIRLKNYTVSTLPTGVQGDTAYVTDATAPTYLGALTGGGSVVCPVFFNGTAWVSH